MTPADDLANALRGMGKKVQKYGDGFIAQCPAHDDGRPSLKIDSDGDKLLAHCFAGCTFQEIVDAAGIKGGPGRAAPLAPMLDAAAVERLRSYSASLGHNEIHYDYCDENGQPVYRVVRTPDKRFFQQHYADGEWRPGLNGALPLLYRLPEVVAGLRGGKTIYVAEGEKDVEALRAAGAVATCNSGGAKKWPHQWSALFRGADVVVIADNDEPGAAHAEVVRLSLEDAGATVRIAHAATGKDAFDHLSAGYALDALVIDEPPEDPYADFVFEPIDPDAPPPPPPTHLRIDSKAGPVGYVFSKGGKYLLTGAQASGKTFMCLALATTLMSDGHKVLWADPDGSGMGRLAKRLVDGFGAPKQMLRERFLYARATIAPTRDVDSYRELMAAQVRTHKPALMVWDSWGPALAALGLDGTNSDADINTWWRAFVDSVHAESPDTIIVVLDHLPKNDSNNTIRGVYGNQRKLSAPDYALTMRKAESTQGAFYVDVVKDRDAVWAEWSETGLTFEIAGEGGGWSLTTNRTDEERDEAKRTDWQIGLMVVLKQLNDSGVSPTKTSWWDAYRTYREDKGYRVGRKAEVLRLMETLAGGGFVAVNGASRQGTPTYAWVKAYEPPQE